MVNPTRRWIIASRQPAVELRLRQELGIPALAAAVLAARGHMEPEAAHRFLNPKLDDLHDPTLLPDYEAARNAILGARERKERIFIHGDYDVDGVTSAALLSRFLKSIGCDVVTHVPHRMKEGYGIHASAVEAAKEAGAKLFLTCDCGIGAIEQIAAAREAGMRVVVTDHHTLGARVPDAEAVVNPHRPDSLYPFDELSGAGVAFKLCEGLTKELGYEPTNYYRAFLDLAALGTIADVMPLHGENRVIAKYGLERLSETKKTGLRALMRTAGIESGQSLRSYHVGYVLGPRLNAAGRIDDAALALNLLLETDDHKATEIALEIEQVNASRRAEQLRIMEEAVALVQEEGSHSQNVIVVAKQGWHAGIIGIVAGRLVELFRRPTFVLTIDDDGNCKGSARSIPNFHLADAIRAYPELMTGGGHAMAAGCAFPHERLKDVAEALHSYAGERLTDEDYIPSLWVDAEIAPEEVTREGVAALQAMEPFGCENPEPVLVARGLGLSQLAPTKKPEHIRALLQTESGTVWSIAFGLGQRLGQEIVGTDLDVAFRPTLEEWRGTVSLKWQIQDYMRSGEATEARPAELPFADAVPV